MLALMPPPPALSIHTPATLSSSGMSVALLPSSPIARGPGPVTAPPMKSSSPSKRPKLSLNTANVPTIFGKGSTSLRLETLSAASPTSRNTFQNTYSPQSRRSSTPSRLALSQQALDESDSDDHVSSSSRTGKVDCSDRVSSSSSTPSSPSTRSASTAGSSPDEAPYQLSMNIRSILSNGPVPRTRGRKFLQMRSPPRKTVSFRNPLTEDVKTCKYTMSNVDLETLLSPIPSSPSTKTPAQPLQPKTSLLSLKIKGSHESLSDDERATCPATPVAGKRKRDRHWVWTLGPTSSTESNNDVKHSGAVNVGT